MSARACVCVHVCQKKKCFELQGGGFNPHCSSDMHVGGRRYYWTCESAEQRGREQNMFSPSLLVHSQNTTGKSVHTHAHKRAHTHTLKSPDRSVTQSSAVSR